MPTECRKLAEAVILRDGVCSGDNVTAKNVRKDCVYCVTADISLISWACLTSGGRSDLRDMTCWQ